MLLSLFVCVGKEKGAQRLRRSERGRERGNVEWGEHFFKGVDHNSFGEAARGGRWRLRNRAVGEIASDDG